MLPALRRSKLLVCYLALGVLAGGLVSYGDAAAVVANDLLLGAYALVIWRVTRGEPTLAVPQPEVGPLRPRRSVLAVAATYLLVVASTFWFWFGGGLTVDRTVVVALRAHHVDPILAGRIGNATPSGIELALLLVLALGVLRLSPAAVCLRPRHLVLGAGLSAFGLGLGILWLLVAHGGPLLGVSPLVMPGVFFFQALVNGIPEEFAFRGVILSRLERLLASPQHALVLSSLLFVSSHTASVLAQGPRLAWWTLALRLVAGTQPTGIAWGYLCHRTRSIWPGAIWHTSATVLGPIFF